MRSRQSSTRNPLSSTVTAHCVTCAQGALAASTQPAGGPVAAPLRAGAVRLLAATWRIERIGAELLDDAVDGGAVLAFWHGEQLPMVAAHARRGFLGMASLSRD